MCHRAWVLVLLAACAAAARPAWPLGPAAPTAAAAAGGLAGTLDAAKTAFDAYGKLHEAQKLLEGALGGGAQAAATPAPDTGSSSTSDSGSGVLTRVGELDLEDTWALVRDPRNRSTVTAVLLVAGLLLTVAGYRLLAMWLFLAGFGASGLAFFVFAPSIIVTAACCGPGTELTRLMISLGIGVCGGLLALFVLKIGLFLTGACLGFLVSMVVMSTPLGAQPFLLSAGGFSLLYFGLALLGGLFALWFQKPFIVATTAIGGAFVTCLALDAFLATSFDRVAFGVVNHFSAQSGKGGQMSLEELGLTLGGYMLFLLWIVMSVAGMVVQYKVKLSTIRKWLQRKDASQRTDGKAADSSAGAAQQAPPQPQTVSASAAEQGAAAELLSGQPNVVVVVERDSAKRKGKKRRSRKNRVLTDAARPGEGDAARGSHFALTATGSGLWAQLTGRAQYSHDALEADDVADSSSDDDSGDSDVEVGGHGRSEAYREKAARYKLRLLELQTRLHEAALAATQPFLPAARPAGTLGMGRYVQRQPAYMEMGALPETAMVIREET